MEQQTQGRGHQKTEQPAPREREHRNPERERLTGPSLVAQAVLEGGSLWDLPPQKLEELAALMGNQGMVSLLEQQGLLLNEISFSLPQPVESTPYPVPEMGPVPVVQPPTLVSGEGAGRAFDPAGLVY